MLGKYDTIKPLEKQKGYDYFMITDQFVSNKSNINWSIIYVRNNKKDRNNSVIDTIKKQRFYKTHPHFFFKQYDLSIYIDTSFKIVGKLDEFLIRIFSPSKNIYNNFIQ